MAQRRIGPETPTLALLLFCYLAWGLATTVLFESSPIMAIVVVTLSTVLHASLTHEMLHGHPFRNRHLNAALVFPNLPLLVPYMRFRDTHLEHHRDANLTDPYDDPESNYLDPAVWQRLPRWQQRILNINNRLWGRLLLGPLLSQSAFMAKDLRLIRDGDRRVLLSWLWHLPAFALPVLWMVQMWDMPFGVWLLCVYLAHSILKIRTFLEHQAHQHSRARTAIVEDSGPLAWLFLHNNLHVVHHMHPKVPWYRLPNLYHGNPERYLTRNEGYRFASYAEVFRRHFWREKDPVPHPLWSKPKR